MCFDIKGNNQQHQGITRVEEDAITLIWLSHVQLKSLSTAQTKQTFVTVLTSLSSRLKNWSGYSLDLQDTCWNWVAAMSDRFTTKTNWRHFHWRHLNDTVDFFFPVLKFCSAIVLKTLTLTLKPQIYYAFTCQHSWQLIWWSHLCWHLGHVPSTLPKSRFRLKLCC